MYPKILNKKKGKEKKFLFKKSTTIKNELLKTNKCKLQKNFYIKRYVRKTNSICFKKRESKINIKA